MDKDYIEKRKKELTEKFEEVKKQIVKLEEQAVELNKKHAALIDQAKLLQGAYAEISNAEKGEVKNVKEEKPKSETGKSGVEKK